MRPLLEVKHPLRGEAQQFQVAEMLRWPGGIVVLFESTVASRGDGEELPAGSVTYGLFWQDRPYNVYRIHRPGGALVAHRCDLLRDLSIGADRLEWTDLLVDCWIRPDGSVLWTDEDQLEEYRARGWISARDVALVERSRSRLEADIPGLASEVALRVADALAAHNGG